MFFFRLAYEFPLTAFILMNVLFIDLVQMIQITRRGFKKGIAQIVSLAGYYGDRLLIILIMMIAWVLVGHNVEVVAPSWLQAEVAFLIYLLGVYIAQRFLPPPAIEDTYHNLFVLPAMSVILLCGGLLALWHGIWIERLVLLVPPLIWFTLLLIDIKYDRLDQKRFMERLGFKGLYDEGTD